MPPHTVLMVCHACAVTHVFIRFYFCVKYTILCECVFTRVFLSQAAELGQTLNDSVIKPTQEKVTSMFVTSM